LGGDGAGEHFNYLVESPYERVDGHRVYEAHGIFIPERARIGIGIWTTLPIRDGRSQSLDGQGLSARWRRFRVRGVDD
jgi:hypothetical protein